MLSILSHLILAFPAPLPPAPQATGEGVAPPGISVEDVDAKLEQLLVERRRELEVLARVKVDDLYLRLEWQDRLLELAGQGSGRAAAWVLRHWVEDAGRRDVQDSQKRALHEELARSFAGATWSTQGRFDVFHSLRRDAPFLDLERAMELVQRHQQAAPTQQHRGRAMLTAAWIQEDGAHLDIQCRRNALALHAELIEDFPGTPEAAEAAESIWRLERLRIGRTAPDFVAQDVDGNELRLSDLGRKVIVVEFWSFKDEGIAQRIERRRAFYDVFREERFALLGINLDRDEGEYRRALEQHGIEWPNAFTGGPESRTVWKTRRGPVNYVLDRDRVIRFIGLDGPELGPAVEGLLGQSKKGTEPGSVTSGSKGN